MLFGLTALRAASLYSAGSSLFSLHRSPAELCCRLSGEPSSCWCHSSQEEEEEGGQRRTDREVSRLQLQVCFTHKRCCWWWWWWWRWWWWCLCASGSWVLAHLKAAPLSAALQPTRSVYCSAAERVELNYPSFNCANRLKNVHIKGTFQHSVKTSSLQSLNTKLAAQQTWYKLMLAFNVLLSQYGCCFRWRLVPQYVMTSYKHASWWWLVGLAQFFQPA